MKRKDNPNGASAELTLPSVKDLTSGPIKKQLTHLAAPIIGTAFIQIAYSFTDMAWVGHLGSKQLAAVSAVATLTWLAFSLGNMAKIGAEVCVSQALGARNHKQALSYVAHTVSISVVLALAIILLYAVAGPFLIALYRLEKDVFTMSVHYLYIVIPAFIPAFMSMALSGCYNATGHSKIPFKINSVGLVANMILDPLFIYGFNWGTNGAAVATALSQTFVCLLFLREMKKGRPLIERHVTLFTRLHAFETKRIFALGTPVFLLNAFYALITFFMGTLAARAGGYIGVAVINAGGQLEAISWNTSQGFSTALAAFVGQNYAAANRQRLWKGFRFVLSLTLSLGIITTFFYYYGGQWFFSLIAPDPDAYIEGGRYFRIVGLSQVFMMIEITIQGLFYGTGRSIIPSTISIAGNALRIPAVLLLMQIGLGITGVWWAISATSMLKAIVITGFLPYLSRKIKRVHEAAS